MQPNTAMEEPYQKFLQDLILKMCKTFQVFTWKALQDIETNFGMFFQESYKNFQVLEYSYKKCKILQGTEIQYLKE